MTETKIQKGIYESEIIGIGQKGDKVCKIGKTGFIIIVPNTNKQIGDKIKINVYSILSNVGFGEEIN